MPFFQSSGAGCGRLGLLRGGATGQRGRVTVIQRGGGRFGRAGALAGSMRWPGCGALTPRQLFRPDRLTGRRLAWQLFASRSARGVAEPAAAASPQQPSRPLAFSAAAFSAATLSPAGLLRRLRCGLSAAAFSLRLCGSFSAARFSAGGLFCGSPSRQRRFSAAAFQPRLLRGGLLGSAASRLRACSRQRPSQLRASQRLPLGSDASPPARFSAAAFSAARFFGCGASQPHASRPALLGGSLLGGVFSRLPQRAFSAAAFLGSRAFSAAFRRLLRGELVGGSLSAARFLPPPSPPRASLRRPFRGDTLHLGSPVGGALFDRSLLGGKLLRGRLGGGLARVIGGVRLGRVRFAASASG